MNKFKIVVKTFAGLEQVLAKEIVALGGEMVVTERRAVSFIGDQALLYRSNFLLRTALKVLKPITNFKVTERDDLYENAKRVNWADYLSLGKSFVIENTVNSDLFINSMYASLKVKDAIADFFREKTGKRPSVDQENPDIMIHLYLMGDQCEISLDSSGESLHKRGYRVAQSEAPINEVLAAGMILLSEWDAKTDLYDPMCGSGTILIEAAMIAKGIPAGIYRKSFAFEKWPDFDEKLFSDIYNADYDKVLEIKIIGSDISAQSCAVALSNIKNAGLSKTIELINGDFMLLNPPASKGTIITNPPYGERIKVVDTEQLYAFIGNKLKQAYTNYIAWIISSSEEGLKRIGLKPSRKIELYNGSLRCSYRKYELFQGTYKETVVQKKTIILRRNQNEC